MEPREFVETRTKRYMAQALEEFEELLEQPLRELHGECPRTRFILDDIERVKATFRKRLQQLASDCIDLMPSDLEINAFEPVRR